MNNWLRLESSQLTPGPEFEIFTPVYSAPPPPDSCFDSQTQFDMIPEQNHSEDFKSLIGQLAPLLPADTRLEAQSKELGCLYPTNCHVACLCPPTSSFCSEGLNLGKFQFSIRIFSDKEDILLIKATFVQDCRFGNDFYWHFGPARKESLVILLHQQILEAVDDCEIYCLKQEITKLLDLFCCVEIPPVNWTKELDHF